MIKILDYSRKSAIIELSQSELLLAMALIQEGRGALGCNSNAGKPLDQLFVPANVLVEKTRRKALRKSTSEPALRLAYAW